MTLLKQGSLFESKKTMEKKEKKSIHERLQINKEIIAKQQGKDSKEKGVELAWNNYGLIHVLAQRCDTGEIAFYGVVSLFFV